MAPSASGAGPRSTHAGRRARCHGTAWWRPAGSSAVALIGVGWLWIAAAILVNLANPAFGLDYRWHVEAAQRLLETGTPYLPFELAGPFVIGDGAILYPPTAFLLFVPFIWLPAVLWWAVPVAVTRLWHVVAPAAAVGLARHRPAAWPYEKSINVYVFGNPSMWIVAAIAAGHDLAVAVRLRLRQADVRADRPARGPSPELVGGARRARGPLSLLFLPVWLDWLTVVRNSDVSLLYNLPTLPLMLAPLVAWAVGRDRPTWLRRSPRG